MRQVLIIEDNPEIAHLVQMHLQDLACEVTTAHEGQSGLEKALRQHYDLVVLDLMLPQVDGLEVCRQLRAHKVFTPILMLTAKSTELDRVLGLEIGADDYITKPFSVHEFIARVKALFRRTELFAADRSDPDHDVIAIGALNIDMGKRSVSKHGVDLNLTAKEFDLLTHFVHNPGRVYSRPQLLDIVWGYGHVGYEHTVNSHINRLRAKIEQNPAQPEYILTVWGVGYKFTDTYATQKG